jgi:hypothetical protein
VTAPTPGIGAKLGRMKHQLRNRIVTRQTRRAQFLAKEFIEFVVRSDPGPLDRITTPFADHTNISAYSHRPIIWVTAKFFELKRIVSGILQEQSKGASRRPFFCVAFNPSYACQKLRVAREITCDSNRAAHYLQLSLAR